MRDVLLCCSYLPLSVFVTLVCQSAEEFERLSVELSDVHLCLCSRATKCLKVLDNVSSSCVPLLLLFPL